MALSIVKSGEFADPESVGKVRPGATQVGAGIAGKPSGNVSGAIFEAFSQSLSGVGQLPDSYPELGSPLVRPTVIMTQPQIASSGPQIAAANAPGANKVNITDGDEDDDGDHHYTKATLWKALNNSNIAGVENIGRRDVTEDIVERTNDEGLSLRGVVAEIQREKE